MGLFTRTPAAPRPVVAWDADEMRALLPRKSSLLARLKAAVGIYTGRSGEEAYGLLSRIFPGGVGEMPYPDDLLLLRRYCEIPWLRAVGHRIAYATATVDWTLYAQRQNGSYVQPKALQRAQTREARERLVKQMAAAGELVRIDNHPLLDLLHEPNTLLTGLTTRMLWELYYDLLGDTFLLKERDRLGVICALWPIPAYWIKQTPTPQHPRYEVSFRGWQGSIPEEEMLWITDPNPENPYGRGRGVAQALADDLETDQYAARHTKGFFQNRARPDMLITMEGGSEPELKRLQNDWLNDHQGFWRAFKPRFMNRNVQIHDLNHSFADMQLVELRKNERDLIMQTFGIPPEVLGVIENSNRATIDAADQMMASHVTVPRLETQRAAFQQFLVPEFDGRLALDYVSPVREDNDFKLNVMKAAAGAFTMDEWRELAGRGPLPDGQGNTFLIPITVTPTDPSQLPTETGNTGSNATPTGPKSARRTVVRVHTPPTRRKLLGPAITAHEPRVQHRALTALTALHNGVNHDLLHNALASRDTTAAIAATGVADLPRHFGGLDRDLHGAAQAGATVAAEHLAAQGTAIDAEDAAATTRRWADKRAEAATASLAAVSLAAVRSAVEQAIQDGTPAHEAAPRIARLVGLTPQQAGALLRAEQDGADTATLDGDAQQKREQRAAAIAAFEASHAVNAGALALWQLAQRQGLLPATAQKTWHAQNDAACCDDCAAVDGERVPLGGTFSNGLSAPPLHPQCRCESVAS